MYRIARRNARDESERKAVRKITANQLQAWGIISRSRNRWIASITYALLTGDRAFATRVKCGVFKGDSKAVFVDRREFTGPIYEQIEEAHKYILSKINMGCVFEGIQRRDLYELPPDALRELVVNAFAHRNYFEHDAPIFVAVYDTRVEITSPGGLPRGLTVEKVLAGRSKIRNHALAEAFNYMKVIEHWGSGLRRVSKELAEYGVKPLQLEDGGIDVQINVFRNATLGDENNRYDERGARVGRQKSKLERTLRENGVNEKVNDLINDPINDPINLLDLIKENPALNYGEYGKIVGVSEATIKRRIAELKKQGKIVRVGANKGGHWEVI